MNRADLNLLVIFDVIMREQSISQAAELLSMTQPSVSKAVSRMRYAWKDPLFIKHGRGITPTPYAKQLWIDVSEPLAQISASVAPPSFDPMTSRTQIRVALTDGNSALFWPRLRRIVETRAKAIDLYAVPFKGDGGKQLLEAEVDLVLDYFADEHPHISVLPLCSYEFTCVMHPNHTFAQTDLSLDAFCQAQHLLVSLSGDPSASTDQALKAIGRKRRIAVTVNSFSAALDLLEQTELICVMPYAVAHRAIHNGRLIHKPVPVALNPAKISIAWHNRNRTNLALKWLIREVQSLVEQEPEVFR